MFIHGISGTLMRVEKSNQTRFEYVVWFPFTSSSMRIIREGSFIAAKNFSTDDQTDHYSIMRITSVLPSHYALETGLKGYPGFVEEAAINASKDWSQEKPTEDTTKIVCEAVPSTFEITMPTPIGPERGTPRMVSESNIPKLGEKVSLLDAGWTERIVNRELQNIQDQTITLGTLANSKEVKIMVLWDGLIRTHFGVFAYTNAGKSNLLSTMIAKVFRKTDDAKIVIYDLMGEYGALLVDILHENGDACIVYLSVHAMPDSVLRFWKNEGNKDLGRGGPAGDAASAIQAATDLATAAEDIVKTTVLPKAMKGRQSDLYGPMRDILLNAKIKLLVQDKPLEGIVRHVFDSSTQDSQALRDLRDFVYERTRGVHATTSNIESLLGQIASYSMPARSAVIAEKIRGNLQEELQRNLDELKVADEIDPRFKIGMKELLQSLNADHAKSLYILQDSSDEHVRRISSELGRSMLRVRRKAGRISPLVSFIYDEADQFIAAESGPSGMEASKAAAQDLARRGRKYGLGIGIATQRIVHLDTGILGQPHTYFVSKLPRLSDRLRIQEAFGLSDETLTESLRFKVGQWLLISHSATGIDGLPIPVQLPDANERVFAFLDGRRPD